MKKIQLIALATLALTSLGACKEKQKSTDNSAAEAEAQAEVVETQPAAQEGEWEVLFDGTSLDGWRGYLGETMPAAWKLEDGAMVFYPEARKEGENSNIVSKGTYTNFVLSLEWKISEAGNSGIFWGVKEDPKYGQPYATGPEIQVLDNDKHPDANRGGKTHQAGALYDMIAPSEDVTKPVGEWNHCVITIDHNKNMGKVVLNEVEIVNFPVHGEAWDAMVAKSKFAEWDGFGEFPTGHISLQVHGDIAAYRNIKITKL